MATGLMLKKLVLRNLLSFGPEGVDFELGPLNVLIGPNASGKSNLIDAIRLLAACPTDVTAPVAKHGFSAWLHKAEMDTAVSFGIDASVGGRNEDASNERDWTLEHSLRFTRPTSSTRGLLESETVRAHIPGGRIDELYSTITGLVLTGWREGSQEHIALDEYGITPARSVFSQINGSQVDLDLKILDGFYSNIRIFSDWSFPRNSAVREPQPVSFDVGQLNSDASNLILVLHRLREDYPEVFARIVRELRELYPYAQDVSTILSSYDRIEAYLVEESLSAAVPFTRLSDGTLRWLSLLTILFSPEPPSLICFEEPEIGLHPDMLRRLARLLVETSKRTQVVITTHSDLLVSALSDHPEAIRISERLGNSTQFFNVEADYLNKYIQDYALGDAWLKGELGGTRY